MVVIEWKCGCGELNKTTMDAWKVVRNGQGIKADCEGCNEIRDVDIEVQVK